MKQGRSLKDVLVELKDQEQAKKDYIAPASGMKLDTGGEIFEIRNKGKNLSEQFGTSNLFHKQIAQALNIPAKYYELMRKEKPGLLAENVNTWLKTKEESSYMIRSMTRKDGRKARAFLSSRYRRIDNLQVAAAILPLFAGNDQYEVMSSEVTESRLYLKIVNHRLEMDVTPGDTVQAGVMISNSEVGLGAVCVRPLVYRLVCTNGMVVNDMGESRHHVGRLTKAEEDSFTLYSDETIEAEDKAFMLKLRDVTKSAIEEARFKQVVGRLQDSTKNMITGRVTDVVDCTNKFYNIGQDDGSNILNYLISGGDLSQYGLANAVTKASQLVEDYDKATQLEGIGWDIVTMPKKQWNEFNA